MLKKSSTMSVTKGMLQKIEALFEELEYVIRYEKGNFTSGYCLLEMRKIVVINRFFETEGRVGALYDILERIEIKPETLSEKGLATYQAFVKARLKNKSDGTKD
jgi:hypothetical protein